MIDDRGYAMATVVSGECVRVREVTVEALAKEGFGILTEIDASATLHKKLGVTFRPYVILGACNPSLAHQGLSEEPDLGVLLPCSVVIYSNEDGTCTVSALDPVRQFSLVKNPKLEPLAAQVRAGIRRALETVRDGFAG